jgi:hypothetical protein
MTYRLADKAAVITILLAKIIHPPPSKKHQDWSNQDITAGQYSIYSQHELLTTLINWQAKEAEAVYVEENQPTITTLELFLECVRSNLPWTLLQLFFRTLPPCHTQKSCKFTWCWHCWRMNKRGWWYPKSCCEPGWRSQPMEYPQIHQHAFITQVHATFRLHRQASCRFCWEGAQGLDEKSGKHSSERWWYFWRLMCSTCLREADDQSCTHTEGIWWRVIWCGQSFQRWNGCGWIMFSHIGKMR